jgi:serine phosphatase RsbU (regulator of sigma subunit)/CRP-like cAMP-binding protein
MDPQIRKRLRYNVLLETLTDEDFDHLEPYLRDRHFAGGDVIIEDETFGEEVFFLIEGRVRISKRVPDGDEQLIALLHPGDCFGELEMIAGRPRSARVVAVDPCITYVLAKPQFDALVHRSHAFACRLLQVLSVRVRAANNHFVRETGRRLEQTAHDLQKLQNLIEAAKTINSTLNLDDLLDLILEAALRVVDADRGTVYLLDELHQKLWTRVAKGLEDAGAVQLELPVGKGIAGYVAATGDTITIPDAYLDPRFNPDFDRRTGYRTRSILCMPMRNKDGKIIGVFQLLNKRKGEFTADDAHIIGALSVHAAIAVENARLHEQEREKIRIERDLLAAREVQMSLLPKNLPSLPGYEFAATSLAARDVAGDLYDFVRLRDEELGIAIGDVSGKGLPAALLMASCQAMLRDAAFGTSHAGMCLQVLNRRLHETTAAEKFVTLFYAVIDATRHELHYANGGHNPPILIRADGSHRFLEAGGTILGILPHFPYEEERETLSPGDLLVLYSDGISEAMNADREQFGESRLADIVVRHRAEPAFRIKDAIFAALHTFVGALPLADDVTMVLVKRS